MTITNDGTIKATGGGSNPNPIGIYLQAGGLVTNDASGTISGVAEGVLVQRGAGTVANGGQISGTVGISFFDNGGTFNNTVINSGTITGSATAVQFGNGNDRMQVQPGAAFFGIVDGSGGNNVLELAAGTLGNAGTIAGIGSGFTNFQTVAIDAGASWTIEQTNAVGTLTDAGTLTNTGTLTINGTLTNTGSLANSGSITGVVLMTNANGNVSMLDNQAGATISGTAAGIAVTDGRTVITNAGTIKGDIGILFSGGGYGTIDNSGMIIGNSGTAVRFAGNMNKLIVERYGVLEGVIDGSNGINTVVVMEGGTLDAAQLIGFQSTAFVGTNPSIDASTLVENAVIGSGSGSTVLNNAGTLSRTLVVMQNSTVSNTGTIALTGGSTNDGTIATSVTGTFTNTANFTNDGTITSNTIGITDNGGTIVNNAGGLIQGGQYGVVIGAGGTVTNAGTILDDAIAGAALGNNAVLTNVPGGLVSGVTGVLFIGTGASVSNAGTITGSGGIAVQFDAGSNRLTLDTGSVLNGTIDGGGGSGQITLTGTGTLASTVTNFGSGSALTIATSATWTASGRWTIAAVSNAGRFQPGAPGSPLQLTGAFSQTPTGTLAVAINPGGQAATLEVTGAAALAGHVVLVPQGTGFINGSRYTLVNATGGISGSFSDVASDPQVTPLLATTLSYDADDAFVTLGQLTVASGLGSVGGTTNQQAAGAGFDAANAAATVAFAPALAALDTLTAPGLRDALDRLGGENNADLTTMGLMAGQQFVSQIMTQTWPGAAIAGAPQRFASLSGDPSSDATANLLKPWSIWASGYGQSGQLAGDGNSHRLTEAIGGGAVGADYTLNPRLRLGAALGYGHGHFSVDGGRGSGDIDYTELAVYSVYTEGRAYVSGVLGGAFGEGSTRRDLALPGVPGVADADVSDQQALGAFEAGYAVTLQTVTLTPFAGLDFGTVNEDPFTESGAGALDLAALGQTESSVRTRLGTRLGTDVHLGGTTIASEVRLGWEHELMGTGRSVTQSFAGQPSATFIVAGSAVARDSALVGLGLATAISDDLTASVTYAGDLAGGADSHTVSASIRFTW